MKDRLVRSLPYVALAAAAVLVVVLGQQKRDLIAKVEDTQMQLRRAVTEPARGMYMPAFQAAPVEGGAPATIGELPAEGRQVLLMYTTTCPYCLSSIPAWKQITATADTMTSIRATVWGVSLDSVNATRQYITRHALPYRSLKNAQRHRPPLAFLSFERFADDVGGSRRIELLGKAQFLA